MSAIAVGNKKIGEAQPCFIAAEIGINHNGSLQLALDGIDAAAEAGADGVKFQNYEVSDFLFDESLEYEYVSQGETIRESQIAMFTRYLLKREWLPLLKERCDKRGVIFFSTPTGEAGIRDLVDTGSPILKNGSDFLGNLPLIQLMARTGLPAVLSTGMATLGEMDAAVRAFREAGGRDLILLHCTSTYPTPPQDVHLRKIPAMAAAFGCPVGLSDHTDGVVAAIGAVALGACFIEKHFTLDKNLPGPDHSFSADPAEFKSLVQSIRTLEMELGLSSVGPAQSEAVSRREYKLSCVAARALKRGTSLDTSMIAFSRPGTGIPPSAIDWIAGKVITRDVPAGHIFSPVDFA